MGGWTGGEAGWGRWPSAQVEEEEAHSTGTWAPVHGLDVMSWDVPEGSSVV